MVFTSFLILAFLWGWKVGKGYQKEVAKLIEANNIPAAAMLLTKWSAEGGTKDPKYFRCFAELETQLDGKQLRRRPREQ